MSNKVTAVRIKQNNSYSEKIPIGALASNIAYNNDYNLLEILGVGIDIQSKGSIKNQLDALRTNVENFDYQQLQEEIKKLQETNSTILNEKLSLACLGDSFVDYRSAMCWNSQGFAADDNYFYVYRVGRKPSTSLNESADRASGHLQKINRSTLETIKEVDYIPQTYTQLGINYTPESGSSNTNYGLEHCNDMTVITINNTQYLLAVAGNTIDNDAACSKVYLIDVNTLAILAIINIRVNETVVSGSAIAVEQKPIYRIAAKKGTNIVYVSGGQSLYKTIFSYNGTSLTYTPMELIEGVVIKGNQGMDYENGYIYAMQASTRSVQIIDTFTGNDKIVRLEYIMQGYILAEPESCVVFNNDIYIVGGSSSNSYTGISQTLICYSNFKNQTKFSSSKTNVKNIDDPIALFVGQPYSDSTRLVKIVESENKLPNTGNNYVNYYILNENNKYDEYIWNNSTEQWAKSNNVLDSVDENNNISDDGSYDFEYRNGYASKPFSSIYTALLAAKSLYLLGFGVQFNIHLNIPIKRNIRLYGYGFPVTLTSDIQYAFPADAEALVYLYNFNGIVNINLEKLIVSNGSLNCTGSIVDFEVGNGAIVYTNSNKNFSLPTTNGLIVGNNKIFARNGIYTIDSYKNGNSNNYTKDLYKIFKKVGVIGDSLAVGHINSDNGRERRNLDYSWPHCIGRDANTEWLVFGQSGQTTESWLHNRGTNMPDDQGYGLNQLKNTNNKCQMYIIALGQNDADMSSIDMPLGDIISAEYDLPTENNPTPHNPKVSSFYCYYYNIIMEIKNVNPEAIIICLTNPNAYSYRRKQMNAAIRNIVDKKFNDIKDYTVMVLDLETDYAAAFTGLADPQDIDNSYGQTKYDDPNYVYVFNNNKNLIAQQGNRLAASNNSSHWDHYTAMGYRMIANIMEEAISKTIVTYANRFRNIQDVAYDAAAGSELPNPEIIQIISE